ncbi:MAG: outer membrane beta-barrel protein [Tatlockia sp.]|nr:outer membrane beta-barrel protein [Tatlockia sp.]
MKGLKLALPLTLACNCVLAGTMGPYPTTSGTILTLSMGPSWSVPGETQTILLQTDFPQTYPAIKHLETSYSGEVFLGRLLALTPRFYLQFGFALAGTTRVGLQGDIWQEADPDFNNFSYSYKIEHLHTAVKGKLLPNINRSVQPYLSASIGVGFNHAYNFSTIAKSTEVDEEAPFASRTQSSFTYTLGAGLQKKFCTHYAIGIGYEFADWGRSQLASSLDQTIGRGLRLNHLYTHQIQFSLSFIA